MAIPTPRAAQAQLGVAHRWYEKDDPRRVEARRNLVAANIKAAIERHLADAPPLTDEQKRELSALLRVRGH